MKIGLYGGTFDPVHRGHVAIAQAALKQGLDQVIVIPCHLSPHKLAPDQAAVATPEHRLKMLQLAFTNKAGIEVSDWELRRADTSYTWQTIQHFQSLFPHDTLVLVTGRDQLKVLNLWARFEEWKNKVEFLSFNRAEPGSDLLPDFCQTLKLHFITELLSPCSSTEIRKQLADGKPTTDQLPPAVAAYISAHNLYRRP